MSSFKRLSKLAVLLQYLPFAISTSSPSPLAYKTTLSYSHISSSDPSSPQHLATISYDPLTSETSLDSWTPPSVPSIPYDPSTQNLPLIKILTESGSSTLTSLAVFNTSSSSSSPEDTPNFDHDIIINLSLSNDNSNANNNPIIYSASITSTPPTSDPAKSSTSKLTKSGKPKSAARLAREAREAARDAKAAEKARLRSEKKSASSNPPGATPSSLSSAAKTHTHVVGSDSHIQIHLHSAIPGPVPQLAPARKPRLAADGKTPLTAEQAAAVEDQEANKEQKSFFQKYWWVFLVITVLAMGGSGEK